MRTTRFAVVALIAFALVAGVLVTQAVARTAPDPACRLPDALAARQASAVAAERYLDLLKATPGLECAVTGYIEAAAPPTPAPTPEALPDPTKVFAAVIALDNKGLEAEAKAAYIEVVKANPAVTPPESLSHLDGDDGKVPEFIESVGSWHSKLVDLLTTVVAAFLTLFLLWNFAKMVWRRLKGPELDIRPFETSVVGSSIGTTIAESVQSSYTKLSGDQPALAGKLVVSAGAAQLLTLPAGLETTPANFIVSFVNWLQTLLQTCYLFTGTAVSDPKLGAGIILTLEKNNRIKKTETIWYRTLFGDQTPDKPGDPPPAKDYLCLAETAAIRLYSWMLELEESRSKTKNSAESGYTYRTMWSDWTSFALFRNSITVLTWGSESRAVALLHNSLHHDPTFLPARMNLATLAIQGDLANVDLSQNELAEACVRYRDILKDLYDKSIKDPADKTLRPRLLFNYLAATDYVAGWKTPPHFIPDDRALLEDLQVAIVRANNSRDGEVRKLAGSLGNMMSTLMVRGPFTRNARPEGPRIDGESVLADYHSKMSSNVGQTGVHGSRALYASACFCAAAFHHDTNSTRRPDWAKHGLSHLEQALELSASLKGWAGVDPSLEPFRISDEHSGRFFELVHVPEPEAKKPEQTEHVLYFGRDSDGNGNDTLRITMESAD